MGISAPPHTVYALHTVVGAWQMILDRLQYVWRAVLLRASQGDDVARALQGRIDEMTKATEKVPFYVKEFSPKQRKVLAKNMDLSEDETNKLMDADGASCPLVMHLSLATSSAGSVRGCRPKCTVWCSLLPQNTTCTTRASPLTSKESP